MANDDRRGAGSFHALEAPGPLGPSPVAPVTEALAPHVVSVNPHPCEPTPADWVADWIIETRIPWVSFSQAKQMVARVLERRHLRKPLTPWEAEILAAWDTTCATWALEMAEEGK
jgi:hypothetical protein